MTDFRKTIKNILNEAFGRDLASLNSKLVQLAKSWGGKVYIVGGAVRDELMGVEPKDIDYLVTKIELPDLAKKLQNILPGAKVNEVGQSFGIIKLNVDGEEYDFAIPRADVDRDNVTTDPNIPVEQDLLRRDITINSMAKDVETGEIISAAGENGVDDVKNKIIKATGDPKQRFKEDPLRMLRAIQFAARFGFDIEQNTLQAIQELKDDFNKLSIERFRDEFVKGWTKGNKDTKRFLSLMMETGVGSLLFGSDWKPIAVDIKNLDSDTGFKVQYIANFLNGGDFSRLSNITSDHDLISTSKILKKFIDSGVDSSDIKKITKHGDLFPIIQEAFKRIEPKMGESLSKILSKPLIPRMNKNKWNVWELPVQGGEIIDASGGKLLNKAVSMATMKLIMAYQNGEIALLPDDEEKSKELAKQYIQNNLLNDKEIKESNRLSIFESRIANIFGG